MGERQPRSRRSILSRADPTLLIVIGARRIDCGVMAGNAWRRRSVPGIPFAPQTEGLLAALRQLPGFQSTPAANPAAVETGEPIVETGRARVDTRVDKRSAITQIKVLISEAWLPTISVPWNPAACMTAATARTYAQVQLRAAGFEFSSADEIRLDDAPYGQPRMVVAYPSVLLEATGKPCPEYGSQTRFCIATRFGQRRVCAAAIAYGSGLNQTGFALALIEDQQVTFVRYAGEQLLQLISRSLLHSSGEDAHLQNAEMAVWAIMAADYDAMMHR